MAKKQLIRLTENDLHNIIKESINQLLREGYSTPSLKDRTSFANYANVDYYDGGIDDEEDSDSIASTLNQVYTHLIDIKELLPNDTNIDFIGDFNNGSEKYFKYLIKCVDRAQKCIDRIVKINQMNKGMQPLVYGSTNSSPIANNDNSSANPYYKRGGYNKMGVENNKELRYKSADIYNPENPRMN